MSHQLHSHSSGMFVDLWSNIVARLFHPAGTAVIDIIAVDSRARHPTLYFPLLWIVITTTTAHMLWRQPCNEKETRGRAVTGPPTTFSQASQYILGDEFIEKVFTGS